MCGGDESRRRARRLGSHLSRRKAHDHSRPARSERGDGGARWAAPRVVDFSLSPDSLELGRSATARSRSSARTASGFGSRRRCAFGPTAMTSTARSASRIAIGLRRRGDRLGLVDARELAKDITEKFQGQHPTRVARSVNAMRAEKSLPRSPIWWARAGG